MINLDDIRNKLAEYEERFRNGALPGLEISELYSLLPEKNGDSDIMLHWPDNSYPHSDRFGVYLFLDKKMDVIYIGKASMNNTLGRRINTYFRKNKDGSCKPVHQWSKGNAPEYVVTIPVLDEMSFEAPALEEYLIKSFSTLLPNNKMGTIGSANS